MCHLFDNRIMDWIFLLLDIVLRLNLVL